VNAVAPASVAPQEHVKLRERGRHSERAGAYDGMRVR